MTDAPNHAHPESSTMTNPIDRNFTYHAPFGDQPKRYQAIRACAKELAALILSTTPQSRKQSLALTNVEQAMMWANAAIARNESPAQEPQP